MKNTLDETELFISLKYEIVTSGYTDRWLKAQKTITFHDIESRFECIFTEESYLKSFLKTCYKVSDEQVNEFIKSASESKYIHYEYKNTVSSAKGINVISNTLLIISRSTRQEIKPNILDFIVENMKKEDFYAICTGLYYCNAKNLLKAQRNGYTTPSRYLVNVPGFELDAEFDINRVKESLSAWIESTEVLGD
jgi:hypothetical protein